MDISRGSNHRVDFERLKALVQVYAIPKHGHISQTNEIDEAEVEWALLLLPWSLVDKCCMFIYLCCLQLGCVGSTRCMQVKLI